MDLIGVPTSPAALREFLSSNYGILEKTLDVLEGELSLHGCSGDTDMAPCHRLIGGFIPAAYFTYTGSFLD